ncbi:hypothetical protein QJS04_geneDACA022164 [Acorus gramineus]|uniref:Uncharacterized protein n=1 Tax=Acorus gramineus TaxID=55184 RepID=A0AAV9BNR7_ACOGR|nr:hypothetical protein QJS04_geneDACA022164 [Acorus gramineus]
MKSTIRLSRRRQRNPLRRIKISNSLHQTLQIPPIVKKKKKIKEDSEALQASGQEEGGECGAVHNEDESRSLSPSEPLHFQEAMHPEGCVPAGSKEEGGRKPQDLLPHEGHHVPCPRAAAREVQVRSFAG